jgi:Ca2+-binding RTX toxin-like protein
VVSGGSFTISSLFENAQLLGAGTLYGNGAANLLEGSDFADLLIGGNGDDTLVGGRGADTLSGGNGNDVYRITDEIASGQASTLGDRILNFGRVAGSNRDLIDVSHYTPITLFPALGFQSVVPFGSADDGKAGVISYQVIGGAYTILRGYQGTNILGFADLEFEIRVDIAGPWTSADFIL